MSESRITRKGGCLCGDVRYEITGEPIESVICHCRMCQRWSGTAFAAAAKFPAAAVIWHKDPTFFQSSDTASRSFYPNCGSSLGFHVDNGFLWISLGSLDIPEQLKPEYHIFSEEELSWAHLNDDLRHHAQFPPE